MFYVLCLWIIARPIMEVQMIGTSKQL